MSRRFVTQLSISVLLLSSVVLADATQWQGSYEQDQPSVFSGAGHPGGALWRAVGENGSIPDRVLVLPPVWQRPAAHPQHAMITVPEPSSFSLEAILFLAFAAAWLFKSRGSRRPALSN